MTIQGFQKLGKLSLSLLLVFFLGCATSSSIRQDNRVAIILKDGTEIEAQVIDISSDEITFEAVDKKKAFDYGERIPVDRVRGIQNSDGVVLSVQEYRALMKGRRPVVVSKKRRSNARASSRTSKITNSSNPQYEEIKNKPIAEMTDNEFKFFMMMKAREFDLQNSRIQSEGIFQQEPRQNDLALEQLADSIVEAGLAANYLSFLKDKAGREGLTSFEERVILIIERHPDWQKQLESLNSTRK